MRGSVFSLLWVLLLSTLQAITTNGALLPAYPAHVGTSGLCQDSQTITGVPAGVLSTSYGPAYPNYIADMRCSWRIEAPAGQIVVVTFNTFHTECGWDWVKIYDGPDAAIQIAALCGPRNVTIVASTQEVMTITFESDSAVETTGFTAQFETRAALETTGFSGLTPRVDHSLAYDEISDSMVLMYGRDGSSDSPLNDTFVYSFAAESWSKLDVSGIAPRPRYGHSTWMVGGYLVLYGGIIEGQPTNEIWLYSMAMHTWEQLAAFGDIPLVAESSTALVVEGGGAFTIYVVGGVDVFGTHFSRYLYSYSSLINQWTTLRPIPVRTTGATLTYHPTTNTLYLLGGSRAASTADGIPSYKYSIDSGEWYLGPMQPIPPVTRGAAAYLGDDVIAMHGGLRPLMSEDGVDAECMPADTVVLDAASDQFLSIAALPPAKARRRGHAIAVRQSSVLLNSGSNGRLLSDNATIPTSSLLSALPARAVRDASSAATWCARWYDCGDCVGRPMCGWCGGSCVYEATTNACPTLTQNAGDCPSRTPLQLQGDPFADTVAESSSNSYILYIDEPYQDILFQLNGADVAKLNMSILSIQPVGSVYSATGSLTIGVDSPYHMSAPYVVSVSYPAVGVSFRRRDAPLVAHYTIAVTTTTPAGTGGLDPDPGGLYIDAQDVATFIVVFVASIIASLLATCAARRVRDRVHLVRLMRAGQVAALPRDPPAMYEVAVDLAGRGGSRQQGEGKGGDVRNMDTVLRSATMDEVDTDVANESYRNPGFTRRRPLAVHPIGESNPQLVRSLATSFLMTFPAFSDAHPLSRLKVATAIYRDATTTTAARKSIDARAPPRQSLWRRLTPLFVVDGWEFVRDVWNVERLLGLQA
ncbi:hypothetical protein HDU87_001076 [Geranomyces variabilis]|uniref:CUB domain-containing protein n=1 Tax=Geranomyces variabilis TaxID=109894 RepID=A0AAD5TNP3_9FUNG|nr:hypothetical protein HDU87_001076 [Geranomyces variabilis]